MLLFCLNGSAVLRFNSFSFTLTPESVAAIDVYRLCECRCTAGTELMEYLPREGHRHGYEFIKNQPAFTVIPAKERLTAWANTVASRIDAGAIFGKSDFCTIGVQLRDCSEGEIPYPFSCAAGCPLWGRCAGTAGYEGTDNAPIRIEQPAPTQTSILRGTAKLVTIIGICIWGGLLLYCTLIMVIKGLP